MEYQNSFNGFVRFASCIPPVYVGNVRKNTQEITGIISSSDADVLVFPELCVTGYTCGDLFFQSSLLAEARQAVIKIAESTVGTAKLAVIGAPLVNNLRIYDCAVVIYDGEILGVVPKSCLSLSERRFFSKAEDRISDEISIDGVFVPFSEKIIFKDEEKNICIGVETGEDLISVQSPSLYHIAAGANVILNPAAAAETVSATEKLRNIIAAQSEKYNTVYVHSSAAPSESTSDFVMSGYAAVFEGGKILVESKLKEGVFSAAADVQKLCCRRLKNIGTADTSLLKDTDCIAVDFASSFKRRVPEYVNAYPFVPAVEKRFERCSEILNIQSEALFQRMRKTGIKKAVIGISGGLDSTLALIVVYEAFKKAGLPFSNILAYTMPGFGTSSRTLNNSLLLMEKIGATARTIDIKAACLQHFQDIGHDPESYDVTYENVQARERTQILMDIANKEGAVVVGTGDLSELALGWCTYNGDHMSMYGVNASVPKTLVRYIVDAYADMNSDVKDVLKDICDTPISPELLPTDAVGNIAQKTENAIGKYDIHDFILYNMVRNGFCREKITELAFIAFSELADSGEIEKTVETFYHRFYSQQFKRNCQPDGPKVGSVCLSPRGGWNMPSDADYS